MLRYCKSIAEIAMVPGLGSLAQSPEEQPGERCGIVQAEGDANGRGAFAEKRAAVQRTVQSHQDVGPGEQRRVEGSRVAHLVATEIPVEGWNITIERQPGYPPEREMNTSPSRAASS